MWLNKWYQLIHNDSPSSFCLRLSTCFFGIFFFGQSDKILSTVQRHQSVLRGRWRQKRSMMRLKQVRLDGRSNPLQQRPTWQSTPLPTMDWLQTWLGLAKDHVLASSAFSNTAGHYRDNIQYDTCRNFDKIRWNVQTYRWFSERCNADILFWWLGWS